MTVRFLTLLFVWLAGVGSCAASCIDSVSIAVKPVSCYSYRDGELTIIQTYGGEAPYFFSLDSLSFSTRPFFNRLYAGEYALYVRDAKGCVSRFPFTVTEPDLLQVSLHSSATTVNAGEWIAFEAIVDPPNAPIASVNWRPMEVFVQNELTQTVALRSSIQAAVEVVSPTGCTARADLWIEVLQVAAYFPNIIKPGSLLNAWFNAYAGEGVSEVRRMLVMSRQGDLVFSGEHIPVNDPFSGWNGLIEGRPALPGVYVWYVELLLNNGDLAGYRGDVTVVR
ncbi:MAG: hypothetical protein ACK4NS_10470 [Saprospiraceae bacterium]